MKTLSFKTAIALIVIAIFFVSLNSCSKKGGNNPNPVENATPVITSLNVNQGSYETEVDIIGTGFSGTPTDNKVKFNGKDALIALATFTKLKVYVPLAAGTGPVTVTVNSKTATSASFTYIPTLVVTTFAGNDNQFGVDDGAVGIGKFSEANRIAFDKSGNMFITDWGNNTIRKATPDGTITTFAGNGNRGTTDGLGKQATFDGPTGITVDGNGNVYVVDYYSNLLRKITPQGQVTTLAGNNSQQYTDGIGKSAGFYEPLGITIDASENLFLVERMGRVRKITPDGVVTTFAGNGHFNLVDGVGINAGLGSPIDITIDKTGNLYTLDGQSGDVRKITPGAVVSTYAKTAADPLSSIKPNNLAMDGLGNLYVADASISAIKIIKPDKTISFYAGGSFGTFYNGPALKAILIIPQGIAFDSDNNLYFTDRSNVRKVWVQ